MPLTARTWAPALALAMTAACAVGCETGGAVRRMWSYESRAEEPVTLPLAGPVAVDVESFGGCIGITADDSLREATVTVRREARLGFIRKKEAKRSLDEIGVDIEVAATASGPRLEIRAWTDYAEPRFQRAHLQVTLPGVNGLTVRNGVGNVEAIGIEGTVHIETTGGDVRVMTKRPMRQAVTVVNREGDIDYRIRGESTGAFDCRTVGGLVLYRALQGRFIVEGATADTLRATLNRGENPVQLLTTGGNVRVAVVADPTAVGTRIVDP
jgi:hypothetical protein